MRVTAAHVGTLVVVCILELASALAVPAETHSFAPTWRPSEPSNACRSDNQGLCDDAVVIRLNALLQSGKSIKLTAAYSTIFVDNSVDNAAWCGDNGEEDCSSNSALRTPFQVPNPRDPFFNVLKLVTLAPLAGQTLYYDKSDGIVRYVDVDDNGAGHHPGSFIISVTRIECPTGVLSTDVPLYVCPAVLHKSSNFSTVTLAGQLTRQHESTIHLEESKTAATKTRMVKRDTLPHVKRTPVGHQQQPPPPPPKQDKPKTNGFPPHRPSFWQPGHPRWWTRPSNGWWKPSTTNKQQLPPAQPWGRTPPAYLLGHPEGYPAPEGGHRAMVGVPPCRPSHDGQPHPNYVAPEVTAEPEVTTDDGNSTLIQENLIVDGGGGGDDNSTDTPPPTTSTPVPKADLRDNGADVVPTNTTTGLTTLPTAQPTAVPIIDTLADPADDPKAKKPASEDATDGSIKKVFVLSVTGEREGCEQIALVASLPDDEDFVYGIYGFKGESDPMSSSQTSAR